MRWIAVGAALVAVGGVAHASTWTLSDVSTDSTPAGVLDATFDFQTIGGNTLQLQVFNQTTAPAEFNINEVFFNGSGDVSGLTLVTANHSVEGDVFGAWDPVETNVQPEGLLGVFGFALTGGTGATNPSLIGPGENIVFTLSITGTCADNLNCDMPDFDAVSSTGFVAGAKFVNGPGDDSAFGGVVPEPSTAALLALGLAGLACARRSRR